MAEDHGQWHLGLLKLVGDGHPRAKLRGAAVIGNAQGLGVVAQDLKDPEDGALAMDAVADITVGAHDKIQAALPVAAHVGFGEGLGGDVADDHDTVAGENKFRRKPGFEGGTVGVGLAGAGHLMKGVVGADTGNKAARGIVNHKGSIAHAALQGGQAADPLPEAEAAHSRFHIGHVVGGQIRHGASAG
jgi:hypothetical protein